MFNILVTTDFSDKSKAGLYFAIQLANQLDCHLTLFHVGHILTPTAWNLVRVESHIKEQTVLIQEKLVSFAEKIYASLQLPAPEVKCVVRISVFPEATIRQYASNNAYDFICISTRGAGKMERVFGTNTANLIGKSTVPVIAVPFKYKPKAIKQILYASDLENFGSEILDVIAFAKPLDALIQMVHFKSVTESREDLEAKEKAVKEVAEHGVELTLIRRSPGNSIVADIELVTSKIKPSMIVMFTNQSRNFLQRIFVSSKAEEYTFNAKVPILVFSKSHSVVADSIDAEVLSDAHTQ
jgi:nucleotide-binding universal stress UspA family protein